MSHLVLDLRDNQRNTADGLRLTNAVASGTAGGYRVESQLRTRAGVRGLSMRLTAPDGRVLDVVGEPGVSPDNAKSPVTGALSHQVGYALRNRLSATQEREAVRAIEATITTGLHCLPTGIAGRPARILVQCAALGYDHDTVVAFLDQYESLAPRTNLKVAPAGWLLEAGFTPQTALDWFPTRHFSGKSHVLAAGHFRRNGWTEEDRTRLGQNLLAKLERESAGERVWVGLADADEWCRFTPAQALAASQAGLSAATTRRLLRENNFNAQALEMLGGLLANPFGRTLQLIG
jgi:hypothetical protein